VSILLLHNEQMNSDEETEQYKMEGQEHRAKLKLLKQRVEIVKGINEVHGQDGMDWECLVESESLINSI